MGQVVNFVPDYPDADGTDAAHPAWWRGNEAGVRGLCVEINRLLDGRPLSGACGEPWESTRRRIAAAASRPDPDNYPVDWFVARVGRLRWGVFSRYPDGCVRQEGRAVWRWTTAYRIQAAIRSHARTAFHMAVTDEW